MKTCLALLLSSLAFAQKPDLSGAWEPFRAGRNADPKLVAPPATPLVLKQQYVKDYEAQQQRAAESLKKGEQLATGGSQCIPYGMPTMMSVASYPVEFIMAPKQITIITEAFSEVRRVYMDQPASKWDEVPPGYYGRSTGKWDGDTLVVETVGIKPEISGYRSMPHSPQMKITERIRMVAPGYLHDTITIDDPVTLEKPVTFTNGYRKIPDYEMVEFVCDNNREFIDDKGVVRLKVTK